jgi:hypothetical protein
MSVVYMLAMPSVVARRRSHRRYGARGAQADKEDRERCSGASATLCTPWRIEPHDGALTISIAARPFSVISA